MPDCSGRTLHVLACSYQFPNKLSMFLFGSRAHGIIVYESTHALAVVPVGPRTSHTRSSIDKKKVSGKVFRTAEMGFTETGKLFRKKR